jgi:4-aminobutyrate--pyruvate transaminase
MDYPNSYSMRDAKSLVHTQTNLDLHRQTGAYVIERGKGIYVYDDSATEYIDAASGLWCASLGFSNERLAKAAYDQMCQLGYYHTSIHYTHPNAVELAERLLAIAPTKMSKVMFHSTGSESNDFAIKLSWYYHSALGKPNKRKIIGRDKGYHGATIATISVSGKPDMHAEFGLPLPGFLHTDAPYYYREAKEGESEEDYSSRLATSLEALIDKEGPESVAAFIAEPVLGAGGLIFPPDTYFEKIQAVLTKYDILFIVDEVMCGFGRTGNTWGSTTYGLKPDILTCAKAISAGFAPLSAALLSERVYDQMVVQSKKLGNFAHSSTYSAHPAAIAVGLETLRIYEEMDLMAQAARTGLYMQRKFASLGEHPLVGRVEGVGLATAIEIVADKATKTMFPPDATIAARVSASGRNHRVLLRTILNRITLSPPLIITEAEVDTLHGKVSAILNDLKDELQAG